CQQALADKQHVQLDQTVAAPIRAAAEPTPAQVVASAPAVMSTPNPVQFTAQDSQPEQIVDVDMNTFLQTLENSLSRFREHQQETLRVHEQYAQGQSEYFRIFFELTQQQQQLLASQTLPANVAEAFAQNMMRFHDYQAETLR